MTLALAALAGPPAASADPGLLLVGGSTEPGHHFLVVVGPAGAGVQVAEEVGGRTKPIAALVLGTHGTASISPAFTWRCERRVRRFVATARVPDGRLLSDSWITRTPSCRDRWALRVPAQVARRRALAVLVRDRWRLGARGRVCARRRGGRRHCRRVRVRGGARGRVHLHLRQAGRWRVELRATGQVLRRTVAVGGRVKRRAGRRLPLVMAVGDSMIDPLDVLLADRLSGRARVRSDVQVGSGLTKPGNGWVARARRYVRRLRPYATVIFLGTNDALDLPTPAGPTVVCCRPEWIAEYARRAATLMRVYTRGGRRRVLWLTLPAPRAPGRQPYAAAVNIAARVAASTTPGALIVPLDTIFTPGLRYRAFMTWHGRRVRVRHSDGIHLSLEGSSIAERLLEPVLELP